MLLHWPRSCCPTCSAPADVLEDFAGQAQHLAFHCRLCSKIWMDYSFDEWRPSVNIDRRSAERSVEKGGHQYPTQTKSPKT